MKEGCLTYVVILSGLVPASVADVCLTLHVPELSSPLLKF